MSEMGVYIRVTLTLTGRSIHHISHIISLQPPHAKPHPEQHRPAFFVFITHFPSTTYSRLYAHCNVFRSSISLFSMKSKHAVTAVKKTQERGKKVRFLVCQQLSRFRKKGGGSVSLFGRCILSHARRMTWWKGMVPVSMFYETFDFFCEGGLIEGDSPVCAGSRKSRRPYLRYSWF